MTQASRDPAQTQMGGKLTAPPPKAPPSHAKGLPHVAAGNLPVPVPGPSLPVWTCEFKPADGASAAPLDNLTVGSLFKAECHGDIEVPWQNGMVTATFKEKESSYTLYVLKNLKLEPKSAELLITAYKPGSHAPEYVRFVQGENGFEMVKPKWEVKSVLPPNEQAKPYLPYGPWSLSLPLWFIIMVFVILAAIGYFVWRTVRRYNQRSKMLAELQRHKTALTPLHQFYRDARNIRRQLHNVKQIEELNTISQELNREFRLYVLRQFEIPTLDWTDREIVRDLKRRHRKVYYRVREPLRKTLRELGRLAGQKQMLFKDVEQLHRMSLDTVEKIDSARLGGSK